MISQSHWISEVVPILAGQLSQMESADSPLILTYKQYLEDMDHSWTISKRKKTSDFSIFFNVSPCKKETEKKKTPMKNKLEFII